MPNNTSLSRRAATRRFSAITTRYGGNGVYDAVQRTVAAAIVSRHDAERIAGELEAGVKSPDIYLWRPEYPDEVVTS